MENETKHWLASRTIWASVLQIAVGVAVAAGLFSEAGGATLIAEGPDLIVGAVTVALGALGIYGRVKATKSIA